MQTLSLQRETNRSILIVFREVERILLSVKGTTDGVGMSLNYLAFILLLLPSIAFQADTCSLFFRILYGGTIVQSVDRPSISGNSQTVGAFLIERNGQQALIITSDLVRTSGSHALRDLLQRHFRTDDPVEIVWEGQLELSRNGNNTTVVRAASYNGSNSLVVQEALGSHPWGREIQIQAPQSSPSPLVESLATVHQARIPLMRALGVKNTGQAFTDQVELINLMGLVSRNHSRRPRAENEDYFSLAAHVLNYFRAIHNSQRPIDGLEALERETRRLIAARENYMQWNENRLAEQQVRSAERQRQLGLIRQESRLLASRAIQLNRAIDLNRQFLAEANRIQLLGIEQTRVDISPERMQRVNRELNELLSQRRQLQDSIESNERNKTQLESQTELGWDWNRQGEVLQTLWQSYEQALSRVNQSYRSHYGDDGNLSDGLVLISLSP